MGGEVGKGFPNLFPKWQIWSRNNEVLEASCLYSDNLLSFKIHVGRLAILA